MSDWRDGNELPRPNWVEVLDPKQKQLSLKDDLVQEFEKRLLALLEKNGATNSLEGWRDVAVNLALELHPAFQIVEKHELLPVSGRPISSARWMFRNAFFSRKRKLERQEEEAARGTRTEGKPIQMGAKAAKEIHAEWAAVEAAARLKHRDDPRGADYLIKTPSAKRIENLASEDVPFPREWNKPDHDHSMRVEAAARAAARRISDV